MTLYRDERIGALRIGPAPRDPTGRSSAIASVQLPLRSADAVGADCAIADLDRQELEQLRDVVSEALE